jgi:hypothetical protein
MQVWELGVKVLLRLLLNRLSPTKPTTPTTLSVTRAVPADGSIASWRAGEERSM